MKKYIAFASIIMIISAITCASADIYAKVGIVTEIDYYNDTITFIDIDGREWICNGVEDWEIYDIVCFILYDNDTWYTREDDEIISITYNGYIEPEDAHFFWEISKG